VSPNHLLFSVGTYWFTKQSRIEYYISRKGDHFSSSRPHHKVEELDDGKDRVGKVEESIDGKGHCQVIFPSNQLLSGVYIDKYLPKSFKTPLHKRIFYEPLKPTLLLPFYFLAAHCSSYKLPHQVSGNG
jgi:hypothetical protein